MIKKIAIAGILLTCSISAIAMAGAPDKAVTPRYVSEPVADLVNYVDVENLQYCSDQVKEKCDQRTAFALWHSCVKSVMDKHGAECKQAIAIFNTLGAFPWKVQAAGPVTIITIRSIADGIDSYYMIDHTGHIISLADDRDDVIKNNPDFKAFKAKDPHVGMMGLVDDSVKVPQVVMPKNNQGNTQIIFPQEIKSPGCVACQTVAVADIAYNFDAQGNFVDVKWLKTASK